MNTAADPQTARPGGAGGGPRVLNLFNDSGPRAQAHALCSQLAPGGQCVDASTVTDAVLQLLSSRIDLLLVDTAWAGDMLPALAHHVRRSAPRAQVLGFCPGGAAAQPQAAAWLHALHDWSALPEVLAAWLRQWQASHPATAPAPGAAA